MTGWHITAHAGYGYEGDNEQAWQALKAAVIRLHPQADLILAKARHCHAPEQCEKACCTLQETVHYFSTHPLTNHVIIFEAHDPRLATLPGHEDDPPEVMLTAAGDRTLTEHLCRAFVRLLIADMHTQGIEVDLSVG